MRLLWLRYNLILKLGIVLLGNELMTDVALADIVSTSPSVDSEVVTTVVSQAVDDNRSLMQVPTPQDLESPQLRPLPTLPTEVEEPSLEVPSVPLNDLGIPAGLPSIVEVTEFQIENYREGDELRILDADDLKETQLPFPSSFFVDQSTSEIELVSEDPLCEGNQSIAALENQSLSLEQLLQVSFAVAQGYACQGYSTSGAVIDIPPETRDGAGVVKIRVIEGQLEDLQVEYGPAEIDGADSGGQSSESRPVSGDGRLSLAYVRSRLGVAESAPLNVARLREHLQLLQLDPLIETISAELSDGALPGHNRLRVQFEEARSLQPRILFSNGRSPSVGTFERQVSLTEGNLFGLGHNASVTLANTDGSNTLKTRYLAPLNPQNGTLEFAFELTDSNVVEPPFDDIDNDGNRSDIESNTQSFELTYRQPILRQVRDGTFQEFALGLTTSWRENEITLLGLPFPVSGADDNGRTRIAAVRFFQEWSSQNSREVLALRSQFNLGLDALGSTVNSQVPGLEAIPDSRFFSWQGQAQWLRVLAKDTLLIVKADAQLADQTLLAAEQFSLGGLGSVRGYRQGARQRDNGVFTSAEVQVPIMRIPEIDGLLQVAPFVDFGTTWNVDGSGLSPNTLASVGLGLQWRQNDDFSARLDYGIPLVSIDASNRTWQENGFLLSVQYTP